MIASLDDAARPGERSLAGVLELEYTTLAVVLGVVALALLLAGGGRGRGRIVRVFRLVHRRHELAAGGALGVVAAAAWVAADAAGYGYGLGFVGAAEGTRNALENGSALPYPLWLAVGVVAGGALRGKRRDSRVPDGARAARAAGGGVLMGIGGSVAHACNVGHGLTGIPLLSLGSLLATASMAAGALLTWRLVVEPRRGLRGRERTLRGRAGTRARR